MTNSPLRRTGLAFLCLALATIGFAAAPKVESLGDNTYSVTVEATHKFTRNTKKLTEEATAAAAEFCKQQGKALKIVSISQSKSMYLVGNMAATTLTFKALDLTDPQLSAPVASASFASPALAGEPAPAPISNEALYADLLRLEDLRKKGILTDDEFKAEKKKVLDRSR